MTTRHWIAHCLLVSLALLVSVPVAAQQCADSGLSAGNYAAYVRRTQEELPRHGYRAGSPSGELDAVTRKGIRAYQRDAGLRVSAVVNRSVLTSIRDADVGIRAR